LATLVLLGLALAGCAAQPEAPPRPSATPEPIEVTLVAPQARPEQNAAPQTTTATKPERDTWETTYSQSWDASPDLAMRELFVLEGGFEPGSVEGNGTLRLPGTPLGDFGALYGPRFLAPAETSLRAWAEARGRRMPTFGIGIAGANGYRLTVQAPARALVLTEALDEIARTPMTWKPGEWTELTLRVETTPAGARLIGVATQPGSEPARLEVDLPEPPRAGRASLWAQPFAGKPVHFDSLSLRQPNEAD
jgi:hypothetical protein